MKNLENLEDEGFDDEGLIEITESERRDAINKIDDIKNDITELKSTEDSQMDSIISLDEPDKILKAQRNSTDTAELVGMTGFESMTILMEQAKEEAAMLENLIKDFEGEIDVQEKSLEETELLVEQCAENIEEELEGLQTLEGEKMINEEETKVRIKEVGEILVNKKSLKFDMSRPISFVGDERFACVSNHIHQKSALNRRYL
mgnify:CR=1 FL=1